MKEYFTRKVKEKVVKKITFLFKSSFFKCLKYPSTLLFESLETFSDLSSEL